MEVFEALADSTRRHMLELLAVRERTAGELGAEFAVSQPAISRHLRVLRDAGLVNYRREAQRRFYRLEPGPLESLDRWLEQYRAYWTGRLDALERHIKRRKKK